MPQHQLIKLDITDRSLLSFENIKDLWLEWIETGFFQDVTDAINYYEIEADIRFKERVNKDAYETYIEECANIPINNRTQNAFHRDLVDQLKNYIVGADVELEFSNDVSEDAQELLNLTLDLNNFDIKNQKTVKDLQNKIISYYFIRREQVETDDGFEVIFKYDILPSEQILPIFSNDIEPVLNLAIRRYLVTEIIEGEFKEIVKFIIYDKTGWTEFRELEGNLLDKSEMPFEVEITEDIITGEITEESTIIWSKIPIIPVIYNEELITALKPIKGLIDGYDIIDSEELDNLQEIQDVIWVLKGFEGEDIQEFLTDLKYFKSIKVKSDGDVKGETLELPTEAREKKLDRYEKNIYRFGRGFDVEEISLSSISNESLKLLYQKLDLKADEAITQISAGLFELISFYNEHLIMNGDVNLVVPRSDVDFLFNKRIIINTSEVIDNILKVSDRSLLSEVTAIDLISKELMFNPQIEIENLGILDDDDETEDEPELETEVNEDENDGETEE